MTHDLSVHAAVSASSAAGRLLMMNFFQTFPTCRCILEDVKYTFPEDNFNFLYDWMLLRNPQASTGAQQMFAKTMVNCVSPDILSIYLNLADIGIVTPNPMNRETRPREVK